MIINYSCPVLYICLSEKRFCPHTHTIFMLYNFVSESLYVKVTILVFILGILHLINCSRQSTPDLGMLLHNLNRNNALLYIIEFVVVVLGNRIVSQFQLYLFYYIRLVLSCLS